MIGIFDSGFGGISILSDFHNKAPEYSYIYFGDNINAPYGDKNTKEIYNSTKNAVEFLFTEGAVLVIVACNTSSARVLRKLQDEYFNKKYKNKKVLGIIIPNIENIIHQLPPNSRLGIIGTSHTIGSQKYQNEILDKRNDVQIFSKACPMFVEKEEIAHYSNKNISYLLLACTHFSFIKKEIKQHLNPSIQIIDSSEIIIKKTQEYLFRHKELKIKKERNTILYTSGDLVLFKKISLKLLRPSSKRNLKFLKHSTLSNN
jgi:glutamate racemase